MSEVSQDHIFPATYPPTYGGPRHVGYPQYYESPPLVGSFTRDLSNFRIKIFLAE